MLHHLDLPLRTLLLIWKPTALHTSSRTDVLPLPSLQQLDIYRPLQRPAVPPLLTPPAILRHHLTPPFLMRSCFLLYMVGGTQHLALTVFLTPCYHTWAWWADKLSYQSLMHLSERALYQPPGKKPSLLLYPNPGIRVQ